MLRYTHHLKQKHKPSLPQIVLIFNNEIMPIENVENAIKRNYIIDMNIHRVYGGHNFFNPIIFVTNAHNYR